MSDTTAGLLQVGAAPRRARRVLPPAGRLHGAGLRERARPARRAGASTASMGVDPKADQRWPVYARSLLAFSAVSVLVLYALQRLQAHLPLSLGFPGVDPAPGVQHGRLVRDQHQLAVLLGRVDDGPPGADGRARRAELRLGRRRHGRRRRPDPRVHPLAHRPDRQLLGRPGPRHPAHPAAARRRRRAGPADRAGRGAELLRRHQTITSSPAARRRITGGPVASQEAIKELGTNGGGFYNANSAHPFENPNALSNLLEIFLLLLIPVALTRTFGRMVEDQRQGYAILGRDGRAVGR